MAKFKVTLEASRGDTGSVMVIHHADFQINQENLMFGYYENANTVASRFIAQRVYAPRRWLEVELME